jgi:hypothetical protein
LFDHKTLDDTTVIWLVLLFVLRFKRTGLAKKACRRGTATNTQATRNHGFDKNAETKVIRTAECSVTTGSTDSIATLKAVESLRAEFAVMR